MLHRLQNLQQKKQLKLLRDKIRSNERNKKSRFAIANRDLIFYRTLFKLFV
jgi:hypothetical protein